MGSKWKSGKLGDYVSSCLGKMLDKKKNKGDYQPYLGNSNVRWGYFELDNLSEMKFEPHELNRYGLKKGDLIVCEGGEPGRCAIWEEDVPTMMIQKALHRIRPFNELDSKYLFYWFLNAGRAGRLDPFFTGTTIKHLTGKALSQLPIDIPPMEHQRYSVNILSSLDDKIQLNKKTNQTLEQMAQAIFKSWFVDFDPVFDNLLASVDFKLENLETSLPDELKLKAQRRLAALNSLHNAAECKASLIALAHELQALSQTKAPTPAAVQILGKTAETPVKANVSANPKILAQHANTHAHFPNEFEHNEQLGWIPKGWTASNVGAEFDVVMGQSPPGSSYNEEKKGIPFFQGKTDYGFRFPTNRVYCTSPKRLARKNDTLVSVRAPVGTINLAAEDCAIGRGLAAVRHKSGSISFTYYAMNDLAKHFAVFEGEGTVFGSINQKDFNAITQLSYPLELILYFSSICSNWDNKIEQVSHQTIVLTKIRDTLLPKLISGELQIPYTSIVEEIVD